MAFPEHHPSQWVADLFVLVCGSGVAYLFLHIIEGVSHG